MDEREKKKPSKIFISHSSQDMAFVLPIVELFEQMGVPEESIFCSSIRWYGVPLGNNIFDHLKEQFQSYDLRVIFVLSENYYNSPVCLNEMGAAWVLQHKYTSILLPKFDFKDMEGVVEQMNISIKLDNEKGELRACLNELRDILAKEFDLKMTSISQNKWERNRDEFIDKVSSTKIYWNQLRELKEKKEPLKKWVTPLEKLIEVNPTSWDAMYMLGSIYAELGDLERAVKYLKRTINLSKNDELIEKSNTTLQNLGY